MDLGGEICEALLSFLLVNFSWFTTENPLVGIQAKCTKGMVSFWIPQKKTHTTNKQRGSTLKKNVLTCTTTPLSNLISRVQAPFGCPGVQQPRSGNTSDGQTPRRSAQVGIGRSQFHRVLRIPTGAGSTVGPNSGYTKI